MAASGTVTVVTFILHPGSWKDLTEVCQLVPAAVTKRHRLGEVNNRNLLTFLKAWESKVWAWQGGFLVRTLLLAGTVFSPDNSDTSFLRTPYQISSTLMTSLTLSISLLPGHSHQGPGIQYTDFEGTQFNPQHEGCTPKAWTVGTQQKKKARKKLGGSEADIAATFSIKLNTCASKPSSSQLSSGDVPARTQ